MKYLYFILISLILFTSCEDEVPPVDTDWMEGVVYFTGEVAVDGCGWLVLCEGQSYHVSNLKDEFKVDGLDIWMRGKLLDETFTCGLAQNRYDVFEAERMLKKPWEARFLSNYTGRETSMDGFSMDSVYIEGDSIHFHVGYSGGCAIHQFNLWILETGTNGNGEPHLMLEHIGNDDPCEAYPWEWLSFSLLPLQSLGNNEVVFWLRGSPQMSMLFGPYTYMF